VSTIQLPPIPIEEFLLMYLLAYYRSERTPATWGRRAIEQIKEGDAELAGAWARNASHLALKAEK
jgi:hypothetical protein